MVSIHCGDHTVKIFSVEAIVTSSPVETKVENYSVRAIAKIFHGGSHCETFLGKLDGKGSLCGDHGTDSLRP